MKKLFLSLTFLAGAFSVLKAQQPVYAENRQMVVPEVEFFVPHWFATAQAGAAYNVGEDKFLNLISPHAQLGLGYQFNPYWGARLSLSGWQCRNRYAYPEVKYKWYYVQPTLEAMLNVTNLVCGWDVERPVDAYAFAGLGLGVEFDNSEAEKADQRFDIDFQKLWHDNRLNPVVRAGIGADYRLTENIAIGAEVNANMLPDHWNSKRGRNDNRDWQFNALLGVKFTLGKTHGKTTPLYEVNRVVEQPANDTGAFTYVEMPVDKISFNVNVYFDINTSYIRDDQVSKLTALVNYLREHPKAYVRLSGFADKDTGTPAINMRLSNERSQNVAQYLWEQGISEQRIRRFAKGDTVQPFDVPEENRVCICYVYDPDNPDPQAFKY